MGDASSPMFGDGSYEGLPTIRIGSRDFWYFTKEDLAQRWPAVQSLSDRAKARGDKVASNLPPEALFALMPVDALHADDKRTFPSEVGAAFWGPYVSAGATVHEIGSQHFVEIGTDDPRYIVSAIEEYLSRGKRPRRVWAGRTSPLKPTFLNVFDELAWVTECWMVLEAHQWIAGHQLEPAFQSQIEQRCQLENELHMRVLSDKDRFWHQLEIGATHIAEPLSRLWYAASMLSLYFYHSDKLRVGYLWAEYQMKMQFEVSVLRHMQMTDANRSNGQKGGQAEKRRERYRVLDSLASERANDFAFTTDREGIRLAKRLAASHDAEAPEPLFSQAGRPLSNGWYEEWFADFRRKSRKA